MASNAAPVPPPTPALAGGSAAVDAARSAGAAELAPVEMGSATGKLERAQALARDGKNLEARRLAEEAAADAAAARAKAGAERSRRAATEAESGVASLRGPAPSNTPRP